MSWFNILLLLMCQRAGLAKNSWILPPASVLAQVPLARQGAPRDPTAAHERMNEKVSMTVSKVLRFPDVSTARLEASALVTQDVDLSLGNTS